MSKIEYLISNIIPCYISTSPKWKLRNNIDVTDHFVGDNEIRPTWIGQRVMQ